jgi:predicted phosphodiesterase
MRAQPRIVPIVLVLGLLTGWPASRSLLPVAPPLAAQARATAPAAPAAGQRGAAAPPAGSDVAPPAERDSVRFAVIGDSGTGTRSQYDVGRQMGIVRAVFPFEFVIMLGDNIYGSERPQDFVQKFEKPYDAILKEKIPFYAALGNHDDPTQRYYKPFNMGGERFYTFKKGDARFFVLDSNYMDQPQLKWLEDELSKSNDRWKVAYFHHPLYSSGARHGSEVDLRTRVEPLFLKHGVDVVFAGHEHFYERIRPQNGIYYFTVGGSAKLRRGNIRTGPLTAAGFDTDYSFMLAELGKDAMQFQVLSRTGKRVDAGSYPLGAEPKPANGNQPSTR